MAEKTARKIFNIFQYDLEEDYLAGMHREGYAFKGISGFFKYRFDSAEPREMVYRLEFKAEIDDEDSYLRFMEDYGWEYLGTFFQYAYFRKPKSEDAGGDDLFTDNESKLAHLRRILLSRGFIVFVALVLNFCYIFDSDTHAVHRVIVAILFLAIPKLVYDYLRVRARLLK